MPSGATDLIVKVPTTELESRLTQRCLTSVRRDATVASVNAETTVAGADLQGELYAGRLRGITTMGA